MILKITYSKAFFIFVMLNLLNNFSYAGDGTVPDWLCKQFKVSGPDFACFAQNQSTYSLNFDNFDDVNWVVTRGYMEISAVSGYSLNGLMEQAEKVHPDDPEPSIVSVFLAESAFDAISFDVDVEIAGEKFEAGGSIDVSQVPVLKNLLSNVRITGNSIVVSYKKPGYGQVYSSARNVRGDAGFVCYRDVSSSKAVQVFGVAFPEKDSILNEIRSNMELDNINCNQALSLSLDYIPHLGRYNRVWSVKPAGSVTNKGSKSPTFRFPKSGNYIITLRLTDICGVSKSYNINVKVSFNDSYFKIDGSTLNSNNYAPDCNKAKGFNVAVEPWLANSAEYDWTLPPGWAISGRSPYKTDHVNGGERYYYRGNNLRYVRIYKKDVHAETGNVRVVITNLCGSDEVVKTFRLESPLNVSVSLPQYLVSCNSEIDIEPIVSDAVAPYKLSWSSGALQGQFENGRYYTANDFENTFVAQRYGNGTITLSVLDARGCSNRATTNVSVFGGNDPDDQNISGWLSGHINPDMKAYVASNIVKAPDYNRIYFVRKFDDNTKEVYYYEFNLTSNKWELKPTGITNLLANSDNTLYYLKSATYLDVLYTIDAEGYLHPHAIDRTTGKSVYDNALLDVNPTEQNYGYTIVDINGTTSRVFWKDNLGNLLTSRISFDSVPIDERIVFVYDMNGQVTLVNSSENLADNKIVRYDVDKVKNRVFYFKTNGGFYSIDLTDPNLEEIQLNGVLDNDQVWTVTDLVFDDEGNVYFTANGDIFFVEFDVNENYIGTYKVETTEGVLTDQLKSGAKGYLGINKSTGVVYYAGYNNNVYQLYRNEDFETSKSFTVVRATPSSFHDNIGNSLVYAEPHLYYRSTDNQMYNLFFISEPGVVECLPKWMRQADVFANSGEDVIASRMEDGIFNLNATVSPNPSTGWITIEAWGNKEDLGQVEIYNLNGNLIDRFAYDFTIRDFNISDYKSGMYVIKITTGGQVLSKKVVKQ